MTPELSRRIAFAFGGLVACELVLGGLLAANVGLYAAGAVVALAGAFFILRHPTAIAYVALAWILFEKSIGAHDSNLTSMLSAAGDGLLVVGLLFAVVVNLLNRREPVMRFGPVALGAIVFVALGAASTIANGVPLYVASLGILDTVRSLLIFLIVINIGITVKDVRTFVYWMVGLMSFSAAIGILQVVPSSPFWVLGGQRFMGTHGLMRVDGLFDHPNSLSNYLALTLPMGVILLLVGEIRGRSRVWLRVGVGLMVLALILTFGREAWIAVPVSLVIVGLLVEPKLLKSVLPPIAVLGLLVAPFLSSVNTSDDGGQRLTLFRLTWPLIKSHWLLGVGPGRYGGHVADVTDTPLYAQYHVSNFFYGTGNQIDQFWTHLLAESGVLGLAAFVSMLVACFIVGRRAYITSHDPRRRAVILGLLCSIPAIVVLSFVSAALEEGPASVLFWGFMGMLVVLALNPEPSGALTDVPADIKEPSVELPKPSSA